jgi:K+-sensing histidine kinase KdpD
MDSLNRVLLGLMALIWCIALAGVLVLVWSPQRAIDIENQSLSFFLNVSLSTMWQIVATAVIGALIAAGLALLASELIFPRYSRDYRASEDMYRRLDARVSDLEGRVSETRREERLEEAPAEVRDRK